MTDAKVKALKAKIKTEQSVITGCQKELEKIEKAQQRVTNKLDKAKTKVAALAAKLPTAEA